MKGLYNIGNNCYINSVIQSAIITNSINKAILEAINTNREKVRANPAIWGYCKLVSEYLKQDRPGKGNQTMMSHVVDNRNYITDIWKMNAMWRDQNDSAEFLFWFADNMKSCGIADPLEGKDLIRSTLSCGCKCDKERTIDMRSIQITNSDIKSLQSTEDPIHQMIKC